MGYCNCRVNLGTKYKICRYSTQQLYLRVAEYGLWCLVLSFVFVYFYSRDVFDYIWLYVLVDFTAEEFSQKNIVNVLVVFAISTVLSACSIRLLTYVWHVVKSILGDYNNKSSYEDRNGPKKDRAIIRLWKIFWSMAFASRYLNALAALDSMKGEPINTVMYSAAFNKSVIKLNMENGISYIGIIENIGEVTETGGVDHSLSVEVIDMVDSKESFKDEMKQLKNFRRKYKSYNDSDSYEADKKYNFSVNLKQSNILSVILMSPE